MTQAAKRLFSLLFVLTLLGAAAPASAQSGSDARYEEGLLAYRTGDIGRARDIWQSLADEGHPIAQYSLGKLYDIGGAPVQADQRKAAEWYRKAALQGIAAAQNNLALMYAQGLGGIPQNLAKAAKLWHAAAESGHPVAQYNIGLAYFNGDGVAMNREQAVDWFRSAGDAGIADAQFVLGQLYRQGTVVPRDAQKARHWYQMAMAQGHDGARLQMQGMANAAPEKAPEAVVASRDAAPPAGMAMARPEPGAPASPGTAPFSMKQPAPQIAALPPADTPKPKPKPAEKTASDGYKVWLASASSRSQADGIWQQVASSHPDVFQQVEGRVVEVDLGEAGSVFRVTAGPFGEREGARELCQQLRKKEPGAFCKVQVN